MVGSIVTHPLFGRGQVVELRNAAREAVVRFDNGIRAVVQTTMLSVLQPSALPQPVAPQPVAPTKPEVAATPEQTQQLEARRAIEALRYGIVPNKRLRELSVGLEAERESLQQAFATTEQRGGDVRVVLGEYGSGKSHFFELAAQEALARNFLVASTSLDLREVPPNRPQRIYNALIRSLRYPDATDAGTLVPLLDRILSQQTAFAAMGEKLRGTTFGTVLHNYAMLRAEGGEGLESLLDWISGEKVFIQTVRAALPLKSKEFPARALSMMTTAADQYCYLLNGWGWLAAQVGYAGLAVLLDESEHYSLLTQRGKERADNFFKALIYTAMHGREDCRLSESQLEHQQREHPFRFADRSQLLVMFAVTPSANTFDYQRWLGEEQIIKLTGDLSAQTLEQLMGQLFALHRQAYGYERDGNQLDLSQGAHEGLERRLLNLRQTIRLAIEVYDTCYAHVDYPASEAVAEMRQSLFGRYGF
ncbi:MAG: BREX system ATP-binding domain-containing protein [Acidobacteriota bacterium]